MANSTNSVYTRGLATRSLNGTELVIVTNTTSGESEKATTDELGIYLAGGTGWSMSQDTLYTIGSPLVASVTAAKLTSNGLGALTNSAQMPVGFTATGFFNETTDLIEPLALNDTLHYRITFWAIPSVANVVGTTEIIIDPGVTPVTIATDTTVFPDTVGRQITLSTSSFVIANYIASGAGIYVTTDVGTINISDIRIFVERTHIGR